MSMFLSIYLGCWLATCILSGWLMWRHRRTLELFSSGYRSFLTTRWKLVTFAISATGLIIIAPYTGDPTWDYIDAAFMAGLTFYTAPWVVGVFYRYLKHRTSGVLLFLAACTWMFSASWSYDGYILLRDGVYPETWLPNIYASSVLYFSAGLLWNLEWQEGRGMIFGFMRSGWPSRACDQRFEKILWLALPFMLIAAAATCYFFI